MWRLYLVPVVTRQSKFGLGRFPKYTDSTLAGFSHALMDFGNESTGFLACDCDDTAHAIMLTFNDVTYFTEDLDLNISDNDIIILQGILEAKNIPANWIDNTMTHRFILRIIAGVFQFAQRFAALTGNQNLFSASLTLGTRYNQLTTQMRAQLQDVAASLNLDTSGIQVTDTIRAVLRKVANKWSSSPIYIGGIVI